MIGVAVQTGRPDKRRVYPELAEGIRGRVRIGGRIAENLSKSYWEKYALKMLPFISY
jgi:hypothetical protein